MQDEECAQVLFDLQIVLGQLAHQATIKAAQTWAGIEEIFDGGSGEVNICGKDKPC